MTTDHKSTIPQDLEAERAFVAAIAATEGKILDDLPELPSSICVGYEPRAVLDAILAQRANGKPADSVSLAHRLAGTHPGPAWPAIVSALAIGGVPSVAEYYLPMLREQMALRGIQAALQRGLTSVESVSREIHTGASSAPLLNDLQRDLAVCEPLADGDDHEFPAAIADCLSEIDGMMAGKKSRAMQTPFKLWNGHFGGLPEASMIALAGRPGVGKTALFEQIILKALLEGRAVSVFEKDMSVKKLAKRLACRLAGVPFWRLHKGFAGREEMASIRAALCDLLDAPLRVHCPVGLSARMLCSIVRREKRLYGTELVVLDHIQALDLGSRDRVEGLTQASIDLRNNITETGIPHIILAHINRDGDKEGAKPTANHIKGFDQLYGDCDGMAILWKDGEEIKFLAAKNRDGEWDTEDLIEFHGPTMTFTEDALTPGSSYVPSPTGHETSEVPANFFGT